MHSEALTTERLRFKIVVQKANNRSRSTVETILVVVDKKHT